MADNTIINTATTPGQSIATKDIGGINHELVLLEFGDGAGGATEVEASAPLPVTDAVSEAALTSIAAEDFATQTTLAALLAKVIAAPSTEAKQDAMIVLLTTIAAITQPLTDVQLRATPVPVSGTVATGGLTDTQLRATPVPISGTVAVTGGGDATAANQVTGNNSLASILAKIIAAPSTEAKQDTGNTSLASILAKIITAPSTEAKQDAIITALGLLLTVSDFDTKTGSLTETAPATDTASSGLNGRLQRIAQRITSLIALLPAALGAGGGLKIDGSGTALPISGSIGNTSFASTIADGADVTLGALADAIVAAGATGSLSAKLRRATQGLEDLKSLIVLAAGTALIGKVGIDQTTPGTTNLVRAGATQKPSIGATVVLAVTALQSIASSATVGWGSVRVSNLATLATDYEIMVKLTTANTAPGSDKCMYVFIVPWYTSDAGSTWFASSQGTTTLPSGTDAAATIASPHNLRLLGVLNYTTQQMVVQDTFLLSNCFGNRMPDGFSITIINFSGAALSTGCIVDYSPINDILV